MGLPTVPTYIQYDLKTLQMVKRKCTSSGSRQSDTACTYPTLILDIQYDFVNKLKIVQ
jgi:hypothetical protein